MSAAENKKRRQKPLLASLWHIELQSIHMIIQAGYSVASATLHTLSTIRPSLRGRQGQHLAHNFELQTTQFSSDIQSEQTYTTNQVKLKKSHPSQVLHSNTSVTRVNVMSSTFETTLEWPRFCYSGMLKYSKYQLKTVTAV